MVGAIGEVHQFLLVAESESRIAAGVAGVVRGGRVTFFEGLRHGGEGDRSGPSAVTDGLELAIPIRGRQPQFHFDVGIGGRLERCGDAAVGGRR